MSDVTYPTCPHDRDTFVKEDALYSYRCPQCQGRVCLDCRRYGNKGFMLPLVDWMTGTCDSCGAERRRRNAIRNDYFRAGDDRRGKERVWDEGRRADADAANPYAQPTTFERSLLEQHEWLREEVQP